MGQALGKCADTIKSQAIKAGLPIPRPGQKKTAVKRFKHLLTSKAKLRAQKLSELRTEWLVARRSHPRWNCSQLRRRFPAVYGTLYRYDRDWLKANQPAARRWWPKGISRCDWAARDDALADKIAEKAKDLKSVSTLGERLTPLALAKAVEINSWLNSRLDKLPRSRWALIREADTTVDFALRHVVRLEGVDCASFRPHTIRVAEPNPDPRAWKNTLVRDGEILLFQLKTVDPRPSAVLRALVT